MYYFVFYPCRNAGLLAAFFSPFGFPNDITIADINVDCGLILFSKKLGHNHGQLTKWLLYDYKNDFSIDEVSSKENIIQGQKKI